MHISQIYITKQDTSTLPEKLSYINSNIGKLFPDAIHVIYNNSMLRDFISEKFSKDVVLAYDSLNPFAYKADLGRYCLLYELGGWYFDIAVRPVMRPDFPKGTEWVAFRSASSWANCCWNCSNAVIYSAPKNPILLNAIDMVIRNCKTGYYGTRSIDPTGPTLLGQALAAGGTNINHVYGDVLQLTPSHTLKNRAFILPNGAIFAWSKPWVSGSPVSLNSLGAEGTNDYHDLWAKQNIYNQDVLWD